MSGAKFGTVVGEGTLNVGREALRMARSIRHLSMHDLGKGSVQSIKHRPRLESFTSDVHRKPVHQPLDRPKGSCEGASARASDSASRLTTLLSPSYIGGVNSMFVCGECAPSRSCSCLGEYEDFPHTFGGRFPCMLGVLTGLPNRNQDPS